MKRENEGLIDSPQNKCIDLFGDFEWKKSQKKSGTEASVMETLEELIPFVLEDWVMISWCINI